MPDGEHEPLLSKALEIELPRWIQVPVGIILGLLVLFCAFAFIVIFPFPGKQGSPHPLLAVIVELILLLPCLWVLEKCFRLVTGRKKRGGLLSPTVLRVVAYFLLIIPVAGLFTGFYREMGRIAIFQAVMYVSGFFGLRALATKREAALDDQAKSEDSEARHG